MNHLTKFIGLGIFALELLSYHLASSEIASETMLNLGLLGSKIAILVCAIILFRKKDTTNALINTLSYSTLALALYGDILPLDSLSEWLGLTKIVGVYTTVGLGLLVVLISVIIGLKERSKK